MKKLIFVYNADSGKLNAYKDMLHKIFSPKTYPCSLCAITYGVFSEEETWRSFRERSGLKMEFLHADEFKQKYASKFGHKFDFPVVLAENHNQLELFISAEELNKMPDAETLMGVIEARRE